MISLVMVLVSLIKERSNSPTISWWMRLRMADTHKDLSEEMINCILLMECNLRVTFLKRHHCMSCLLIMSLHN